MRIYQSENGGVVRGPEGLHRLRAAGRIGSSGREEGISFSSATVAHVMAELEEMGFLRGAHLFRVDPDRPPTGIMWTP